MADCDTAVMFHGPAEKMEPGESPPRLSICARVGIKPVVDNAATATGAVQRACSWCRHPIWLAPVTVEILATAERVQNPIEAVCDKCAVDSGAADFLVRQIMQGAAPTPASRSRE